MKTTGNECKAAFSQIDITPDFSVELIGCWRPDSRSKGVLHPLCAQVLLLESGSERHCLIAIDSLGLTTELNDELRRIIAGQLGTDLPHVMIVYSHTHSAPAPLSPLGGERYRRLLLTKVTQCAAEAAGRLRPCKAGWALAETGIGENRREGCTAVDRRLGALKLADASDGRPIAVLLRVTAHANVLMSANDKISADYFHVARDELGEVFGCPVMLIQGAAGNIKPVGVDKINGGELPDVYRIAGLLTESAKRLRFDLSNVVRLQMLSRKFVGVSDVPTAQQAEKIAEDANRLFGIDGSQWLGECERLRKAGVTEQGKKETVQFFFLNDACLCGVPDEIFCEISLWASERVKAPLLFLNGYTNGCTGYLPHEEEWVKGGYETLYSYLQFYPFHGHVLPFRQDTAEQLIGLVCGEWEKYIGK